MNEIIWIIFLIFIGQILGSLIGIIKKPSELQLRFSLAFAGSMMISISVFELMPEAVKITSYYLALFGFLAGLLIMMLIDKTLPHINPELNKGESPNMKRCASFLVIGTALHNLPEGFAIGLGFLSNPSLGILVALGITIHNIPENIAAIIPVFCITRKRLKSALILITTVLFELFGFILGYFVFKDTSLHLLGVSLALTSGFMMYISVEELIPSAQIRKNPYIISSSILLGVLVVLTMILLF